MNFLSIFDVIGPNMIGPSSSHTAGAVHIALMARKMFPEPIRKVRFTNYLHLICADCKKPRCRICARFGESYP